MKKKLVKIMKIMIDIDATIKEPDQDVSYTFLEIQESDSIKNVSNKEKRQKGIVHIKTRVIPGTKLNACNQFMAIHLLPISLLIF